MINITLEQAIEAQRGSRGITTLFLTFALDGGGWLKLHPSRFTPGKEAHCTLYMRLYGPQVWSGWVQKISHSLGSHPQTVQLVGSHCTAYAVPSSLDY
jgi:hypothetical protein